MAISFPSLPLPKGEERKLFIKPIWIRGWRVTFHRSRIPPLASKAPMVRTLRWQMALLRTTTRMANIGSLTRMASTLLWAQTTLIPRRGLFMFPRRSRSQRQWREKLPPLTRRELPRTLFTYNYWVRRKTKTGNMFPLR